MDKIKLINKLKTFGLFTEQLKAVLAFCNTDEEVFELFIYEWDNLTFHQQYSTYRVFGLESTKIFQLGSTKFGNIDILDRCIHTAERPDSLYEKYFDEFRQYYIDNNIDLDFIDKLKETQMEKRFDVMDVYLKQLSTFPISHQLVILRTLIYLGMSLYASEAYTQFMDKYINNLTSLVDWYRTYMR